MLLFAKRLLLTLLIVPLLLAIILYFAIQTTPAARMMSGWLTEKYPFTLSIGRISHSWSNPLTIQLNQVKYIEHDSKTSLTAPDISLTFNFPTNFWTVPILQTLQLEHGVLQLNNDNSHVIRLINSRQLILKNMSLTVTDQKYTLAGQQINARISPWQAGRQPLNDDNQFEISANTLTVNDVTAHHVLIEGNNQQSQLTITRFGADIARGQVSGWAQRHPTGQWTINDLYINNMRWQFSQSLTDLYNNSLDWPSLQINRAIMTGNTFEGPEWVVNDLDIKANNISLQQGMIRSDAGQLIINALLFKWQDLTLNEAIAKLAIQQNKVEIDQFSSRWNKGIIRTHGIWSPVNQSFDLGELVISGVEYVVPVALSQLTDLPLPDWLKQVTIQRLRLNRNILIDITPSFPIQLTLLAGDGSNLMLIKNHSLGIWQGKLQLSAYNATFNQVDLLYPQLSLQANNKTIDINELAALINDGLLEGSMSISQEHPRLFSIQGSGQNIPNHVLIQWGWQANNINDKMAKINVQLNLHQQPLEKLVEQLNISETTTSPINNNAPQ